MEQIRSIRDSGVQLRTSLLPDMIRSMCCNVFSPNDRFTSSC